MTLKRGPNPKRIKYEMKHNEMQYGTEKTAKNTVLNKKTPNLKPSMKRLRKRVNLINLI